MDDNFPNMIITNGKTDNRNYYATSFIYVICTECKTYSHRQTHTEHTYQTINWAIVFICLFIYHRYFPFYPLLSKINIFCNI